jgi:Mg2+-importing ATPase
VRRDGRPVEIPQEQVVPGDIVEFAAGDVIPGDCLLLEATDLFVDEAALTGETFPAEKAPGVLPAESPLLRRTNAVFMGTHVVSGSGRAVVVRTGPETEFGKIAGRLRLRPPETEFERGVRRFGNFLLEVTLLLVMGIFVINVYLDRPVLQSFLFALALAVGLTPQLLPAIISVNLSHGAKRMARQKVIVKRLAAIENFGSMNVLCVDKTGTLTEGSVRIAGMFDLSGKEYRDVLFYAALNARFETGYRSPVDEALRAEGTLDFGGWEKRGELPYDFVRKRLSVLAEKAGKRTLVTKGAVDKVLDVCETARAADGSLAPLAQVRDAIDRRYHDLSGQGLRLLGVAVREAATAPVARDQEADMTFLGFLALHDPPKAGIAETVTALAEQGVALKIVTGDNRPVTEAVAGQVGLPRARLLTGPQLRGLSDEALIQRVGETDIFAEVEPDQKERIIRACQKAGHVVGYLGDGINDATALHAADVGLSVDSAVDVAKEAADIVLLEKDLAVLLQGVREGRETFANTLKYVFMATSANFGNMFSMAGISLVLPFLPLLPKQILLTNLLTDFPEMAIANDRVDRESLQRPRRWDLAFIRRFMLTFGLLSSLFDYLTFAVLLLLLRASPEQFRSGWFMESVVSATLVVLVIRTRRPLWRSRPGRALVTATLAVIAATGLLPFSPLAVPMGFVPLPPAFLAGLAAIVILYALAAEVTKKFFYRQMDPGRAD